MARSNCEDEATAIDGRPLYLYEQISGRLLRQINDGTYRTGDRLPSVRSLSQLFGVSVSTVMHCYHKLEGDGVLEVRPQSGVFVRHGDLDRRTTAKRSVVPMLPVTVSLSERALRYMELYTDKTMVPLGIALPSPCLLGIDHVLKTLADVLRYRPPKAWDYSHPSGHEALRKHLARRSVIHDMPVIADDILVTSGCMEAITIALRCVSKPGDMIAVESPSYYGTLLMLKAHGRRVLELPTSPDSGLCLDSLEHAFAENRVAACLFSANAQNPLGFTMPRENKRRIAALAARYRVPLIENDIWGDTVYDAAHAAPAKAFDSQGMIIYCNSFSKTLMPGARIGWSIPGRFQRRFREIKQLSSISSPSAPQIAIARLMESGFYDHHVTVLRKQLAQQAEETTREVRRRFPSGAHLNLPSGGCALWIALAPTLSTAVLFERAAQAGIHIFPGLVFSADGSLDNYLRLNTGNPVDKRIRTALRTLGDIASGMEQETTQPGLA